MTERRTSSRDERPRLGPRYTVREPVGAGSGGAVWRVTDRLRGGDVAVKLLPAGDGAREFRILRLLQHPSTVHVRDMGFTRDGRPWFSMDIAAGEPMGRAGSPVDPKRLCVLMARMMEAIGFVHDRGWVHGDLKPDNVLCDPAAGRITLLDFGLALAADGATDLRGTPGFIAPEVLAQERGVSIRSDLYAIGAMGWAALTGELPFPADAPNPGFGAGRPAGPEQTEEEPLSSWLRALLRRDPDLRPSSAREALAALEAATGRALRDPADAVARIAPTEPVGRDDALLSIQRSLSTRRRVVVHGAPGSGCSFLLETVFDRLRAAGQTARLLDLSDGPDASWKALELAIAAVGDALPGRPPAAPDETAAETRERLAVHRVRCTQAVQGALERQECNWLIDCPDPDPLAARVVLAAAAATEGRLVVATRTDRLDEVVGLLGGAEPGPLRVPLAPWTAPQIELWLDRALGRVGEAEGLARVIVDRCGGQPAAVRRATGALLRDGALFMTEAAWAWNAAAVEEQLAEHIDATVPLDGDPEERALELAAVVEQRADQGELRAARRQLVSAMEGGALVGLPPQGAAPLWLLRARLAGLLSEHTEAAAWYALVRTGDGLVSGTERASVALSEVRARQEAGDLVEALAVLDSEAALIAGAGSLELHFTAAHLRAITLMRLASFDEARGVAEAWLRDLGPDSPSAWRVGLEVVLANCAWHQGHYADAADRCARLLAALPDLEPRLRAAVLTTRGTALKRSGHLDDAAGCFEAAGPLYESAGALLDAARVLNNLGILRYMQGEWHAAIAAFDTFRGLVERLGNVDETASALNNLGSLFRDTGQLDRAEQRLRAALVLARRHRLARLEPMVLGNLAEVAAVGGQSQQAEDLYAETIRVSAGRGIESEQIEAWRRVAQLRLDNRDIQSACAAIARARPLALDADAAHEITLLDGLTAIAQMREGTTEGADERAEAAIEALDTEGDELEAARMRLRLAEVLADLSRYNDAADLLDACEPCFRGVSARPEIQRLESLRRFVVAATRNQFDQLTSHYAALQELTLALSQEMDLEALLELILDRTLGLVGFERGYVLLMDGSGEATMRASRMLTTEEIRKDVAGPSSSVTKRVIKTRRSLVALDIDDDDSLGQTASITDARLRSVICVPILRGDALLGVIYVDSRSVLGGSADEKSALLTACADAASVAIENARLVEALRRKNDSLAILAHELRTPLNAMIGLAASVLDGSTQEDETLPTLTQIKGQGRRMSTMITQFLAVARMEAGKAEWRRVRVDALELVVAARDTLFPLAQQAAITLEARVDDDVPELIGDPDRLVQVLVNLTGNAVKFGPAGGTVWVTAERSETGGVRLTVEDEGPGVPEERLATIFEPFQQAGDPSMRRLGVGLGLAISAQIVMEHNGTLNASNRPGGGARFVMELPAADPDEDPDWTAETDWMRVGSR